MKRERPADDIRRWAIKARLQGLPSREIAQTLARSPDTIKGYLGRCGHKVEGTYHLNGLIAKALFSEQELLALGVFWNGRCWVGHDRNKPELSASPTRLPS
jgi:hypothetical protein